MASTQTCRSSCLLGPQHVAGGGAGVWPVTSHLDGHFPRSVCPGAREPQGSSLAVVGLGASSLKPHKELCGASRCPSPCLSSPPSLLLAGSLRALRGDAPQGHLGHRLGPCYSPRDQHCSLLQPCCRAAARRVGLGRGRGLSAHPFVTRAGWGTRPNFLSVAGRSRSWRSRVWNVLI